MPGTTERPFGSVRLSVDDRERELALSAWHEAGHAVAYLSYGRRFRYITLRPRSGDAGMVVVRPRRIDVFTRAAIAAAGPIAQGRFDLATMAPGELEAEGVEPEDVLVGAWLHGGHSDLEAVPEGYVDVAERIAGRLLDQHWPAVGQLAGALVERRRLTYDDAVSLVGASWPWLRPGRGGGDHAR